jgi:DNA replication and repair protein RecF
VLVVGPNGAGKTNLLESLHVGTQGFSPRTRSDAQLIRFGEDAARVAVRGHRGEVPVEVEVTLEAGRGKRAKLNGAALRAAEQLRSEAATLVFTPDRLVVVKGSPAARRAYFDRALTRLLPARAAAPTQYAAALAQRNGALRRVQLGLSSREALEPWTEQVAETGRELVEGRREAVVLLESRFAELAEELGLAEAALAYDAEPPTVETLTARLDRDVERGVTGIGPHLDDVALRAGTRDLRSYGSQGEQRTTVLALVLAEAELIADRRGVPPLLLLDDVFSELDRDRRERLLRRLPEAGQTVITATSDAGVPLAPRQIVDVEPGRAVAR